MKATFPRVLGIAAVVCAVLVCAVALPAAWFWPSRAPTPQPPARAGAVPAPLPGAVTHRTVHYAISSTATAAQTAQVGRAVEALHAAYLRHFELEQPARQRVGAALAPARPLHLVLYRDRAQFKANNRSSPWAEAFYLHPACHAYVADAANPHHWMLHEATHQLGTEVAGLSRHRWVDEGVATYFGVSRLQDGRLVPGTFGTDAYPIWWLASVELDAEVDRDIERGAFIPLRALITDTGPDIARHVNQYYVQYWSLSHFLFHHDNGRYARSYRALIRAGGTLENFERLIGPVDQVQREWHAYLRALAAAQRAAEAGEAATSADVVPVVRPRPGR